MPRSNLATRPFYNERGVHLVLGAVAVMGLALFVALVLQLASLSQRSKNLTLRAEDAAVESADLLARTTEVQRSVSAQALAEVAVAADEVNSLIDQRFFSWTVFFNRIETTLPANVMVTEIRPNISPELIEVTMGVVGRDLEDITEFIEALEDSGTFVEVLSRQEELTVDGMYRAILRGRYSEASTRDFVAPKNEFRKTSEDRNNDDLESDQPRVATERDRP